MLQLSNSFKMTWHHKHYLQHHFLLEFCYFSPNNINEFSLLGDFFVLFSGTHVYSRITETVGECEVWVERQMRQQLEGCCCAPLQRSVRCLQRSSQTSRFRTHEFQWRRVCTVARGCRHTSEISINRWRRMPWTPFRSSGDTESGLFISVCPPVCQTCKVSAACVGFRTQCPNLPENT